MNFKTYQTETEFAIQSVEAAARLVKEIQAEMLEAAFTKDDQSPVTVADFAAQALVSKMLQEKFPHEVLVGEESATELRLASGRAALKRVCERLAKSLKAADAEKVCAWIDHGKSVPGKRFWTLDPIDGTKGFLRGDQFAVALALVENGDVKIGVLACPNLQEAKIPDPSGPGTLAAAVRGEGAWWRPLHQSKAAWKAVQVSKRKNFSDAILLRSFESRHTDSPRMKTLMKKLGIQKAPVLMDSLAKYVVLASGGADLLFRFPSRDHAYESIWDQAAGVIVIEEAGGRATDLDGKPLDFTQGRLLSANRGVLLSNGAFHEKALEALKL